MPYPQTKAEFQERGLEDFYFERLQKALKANGVFQSFGSIKSYLAFVTAMGSYQIVWNKTDKVFELMEYCTLSGKFEPNITLYSKIASYRPDEIAAITDKLKTIREFDNIYKRSARYICDKIDTIVEGLNTLPNPEHISNAKLTANAIFEAIPKKHHSKIKHAWVDVLNNGFNIKVTAGDKIFAVEVNCTHIAPDIAQIIRYDILDDTQTISLDSFDQTFKDEILSTTNWLLDLSKTES